MGAVLSLVLSAATTGYADPPNPFQKNIDRGRAFLFAKLKDERRIGHLALGVMALLKTAPHEASGPNKGRPTKTAALQNLVDRLVAEIEAKPHELRDQEGTYATAVAASCLIADDFARHETLVRRLVARIIADQKPNGSWSYPSGVPANGDTSQVQYVTLALFDAARVGIEIPPRVWDAALDWQIKTQDSQGAGGAGGFVYQPQRIPEDGPVDQGAETATMGVAGLSTMLICQSQLPWLKAMGRASLYGELIRPATDAVGEAFIPKVAVEAAIAAITKAEAWVGRNTIFRDPFKDLNRVNYYLYGYERVIALKRGEQTPAQRGDWYREGGSYLARTQKADGSWQTGAHWPAEADTAFALLFLGKSMAGVIKTPSVTIMPRSFAVGGEGGLPTADGATDDGAFFRQIQRWRPQPTSSIDLVLKFLDDPNIVPDEQTAGIVERLTAEQLQELVEKSGADERKLRAWTKDPRPAARKAALVVLSKSRDVRIVPILIESLKDKDADVYSAARDGLRYVTRNIEVFGLPPADKRTPETVQAGVNRARGWFRSLNVEVAASQEFSPAGR